MDYFNPPLCHLLSFKYLSGVHCVQNSAKTWEYMVDRVLPSWSLYSMEEKKITGVRNLVKSKGMKKVECLRN